MLIIVFTQKRIDRQFKDLVELRKICYLAAVGFGCLTCVFVFPLPSQLRLLNKPTPLLPKSNNLKIPEFCFCQFLPSMIYSEFVFCISRVTCVCWTNPSGFQIQVKVVWFNSGWSRINNKIWKLETGCTLNSRKLSQSFSCNPVTANATQHSHSRNFWVA